MYVASEGVHDWEERVTTDPYCIETESYLSETACVPSMRRMSAVEVDEESLLAAVERSLQGEEVVVQSEEEEPEGDT